LQHTATHCNTLQHTVAQCNNLPFVGSSLLRISTSLVQILLGNLNAEDDSHIDYVKLLSGKLKSDSFPMDVYTAYKTMEQS